jgi:hypothetical protein
MARGDPWREAGRTNITESELSMKRWYTVFHSFSVLVSTCSRPMAVVSGPAPSSVSDMSGNYSERCVEHFLAHFGSILCLSWGTLS